MSIMIIMGFNKKNFVYVNIFVVFDIDLLIFRTTRYTW